MHLFSRLLLLIALAAPTTLTAAIAVDQASAQILLNDAAPLLDAAAQETKRYLDAAIYYSDALAWYELQNLPETISQLQAAIFWRGRHASDDNVAQFQAERLFEPSAIESLNRVNALVDRPVAADHAEAYLNRAYAFIRSHESRLALATMLYYEITERFLGMPAANEANRRLEDLIKRQEKWTRKGRTPDNNPLIIPSSAGPQQSAIVRAKMPDEASLNAALDAFHDLYKAQYSTISSRAALIPTLIKQADATDNDPTSVYALLYEARELAVSAKNTFEVIQLSKQIAAMFDGVNIVDDQKRCLSKIRGQSVISSLIKLLDEPEDISANSDVGKWYATDLEEWDLALPHLAKGADETLAKIARDELAPKKLAAEYTGVADQWHEQGKHSSATKQPYWRHALSICENVRPQLVGLQASVIDKRIAEIFAYLPLGPDIDYDKITAGQWEKLKGAVITVEAARKHISTGLILRDGRKVRLVPHPTDTWRILNDQDISIDTTYKGQSMRKNCSVGELICTIGNGMEQQTGVVSGIGVLVLSPPRFHVKKIFLHRALFG